MILPTKRLNPDRALLGVGAEVLTFLDEPKTVSRLWEEIRQARAQRKHAAVAYDWFVLALDLLYLLNAIDMERGKIRKAAL